MRKKLLLILLCQVTLITGANAQSSGTPITIETATSIAPKDKLPTVFISEAEKQEHIAVKIKECKTMIVKFQNEPSKAQLYREELWRLEHAEVK